jgi:putative exosortase-associated protein (TIGR04073 family)
MSGKSVICVFAVFFIISGAYAATVFADEFKTVEESSAQEVVSGMAGKAARGVANVATGWLELPKQIYVTAEHDGAAKGILLGPLKGIGMTLVRTLAGVGEIATFLIPYPGFYEPFIDPPYVWQKE